MIRNDTILVADSGQWRVVEIRRTSSGWEPIWVLNTAGGKHLKWPRDADRLPNGNTLITDCKNNRVIEVTKNGTTVWEQSFDRIPYEADRHPYKETRDVPRYNSSTSPATEKATHSTQSVIRPLLKQITGVIPLPAWYSGLHFLTQAIGAVLSLTGIGLTYRE